jgi:hypothetical protein
MDTLEDLYKAIDWSESDQAHRAWLQQNSLIPPEDVPRLEDSVYRLRLSLLEAAVNDADRQARGILGKIWNEQVLTLLPEKGKNG